jgi:hypothetical protein
MGFIITNAYTIPKLNITLTNLYVTISGAYSIRKTPATNMPVIGISGRQLTASVPGAYTITCVYTLRGSKSAGVLYTAQQSIQCVDIPVDIFADLYAAIKNNFPNCTFENA